MTSSPNILLVEDDRDQAMLFTQVLRLGGLQVDTAITAEDAVCRLNDLCFSLLLADWDLPGMKGDALITYAKSHCPAMKTMLYSNHASVDEIADACHADAWFRKSDDIFRLRQLVRDLVA